MINMKKFEEIMIDMLGYEPEVIENRYIYKLPYIEIDRGDDRWYMGNMVLIHEIGYYQYITLIPDVNGEVFGIYLNRKENKKYKEMLMLSGIFRRFRYKVITTLGFGKAITFKLKDYDILIIRYSPEHEFFDKETVEFVTNGEYREKTI